MLIHLTSPWVRGKDATTAQKALKHNRFHHAFYGGEIDGVYGPRSSLATKRAKFWLGYPNRRINGAFGDRLHKYLINKKLPLSYRIRRRRRLAKVAKPVGEKACNVAITQIGVHDNGHNYCKYTVWYGIIGPWCAMFVSWCSNKVGGQFHEAYCPTIAYHARHGLDYTHQVWTPMKGDLVLYDWDNDGTEDHIGFFVAWNQHGVSFWDVSGNTSDTNRSNGGYVEKKVRYVSDVALFVRMER